MGSPEKKFNRKRTMEDVIEIYKDGYHRDSQDMSQGIKSAQTSLGKKKYMESSNVPENPLNRDPNNIHPDGYPIIRPIPETGGRAQYQGNHHEDVHTLSSDDSSSEVPEKA